MATTITVVCPNCNNRMKASSEYIGHQGRCPSCKALVEITAAGDPESMASMQPLSRAATAAAKGDRRSTEVPGWQSGIIGLAATLVLYLLVFFPLRGTHFGQLFVARGSIPYVIVLVTAWGVAMLVLKFFAVKRQQSYADLELELIPLKIGLQITPANVDQFLDHIAQLPGAQRNSIFGRRIHGALDHFKSRNSVPEVQDYLATQAEIDSSGVDAGYTLLRAFIWAVPILGFIGTVMGISAAVSGLAASLAAGGDIMQGLGGVTTGLSTAFDTTFIALIMAILLLFPTESLRKIEYHMLDRIEAFANESLLRRMSDERGAQLENMPDVVRATLESAFREHQHWLAQWQAQVAELGQVVGGDFEQAAVRVVNQLTQGEADELAQLREAKKLLAEMFSQVASATESWSGAERTLVDRSQQMMSASERLQVAMLQAADAHRELIHKQAEMTERYQASDLAGSVSELRREIGNLAAALDGQRSNTTTTATAPTLPASHDLLSDDIPTEPNVPIASSSRTTPSHRGGMFGLFRKRS